VTVRGPLADRARRWRLFWPAVEEPEPFTVLRLRCQGSADRWLIAIYKASTETFSERELPTRFGPTTGTPEEGMNHTLGFWVGPPATDQWGSRNVTTNPSVGHEIGETSVN
jgi:hypothetical protein